MDKKSYLDHIAADSRPQPVAKASLFPGKVIKFVIGGLTAFILIIILGFFLKTSSQKAEQLSEQLFLRNTNLLSAIEKYQPYLKSSELRAMSTSLATVLESTNAGLSAELKNPPKKFNKSTIKSEELVLEELTSSLENARLNGLLDRTFAREFALQTAFLRSFESEIIERTKNANLQDTLEPSHASLTHINSDFTNFSDHAN